MTRASRSAIRVLFVEDNFLIGLAMKKGLERMGYHVVGPAPSAEQGLALIESTEIDVAVLDVALRDGDSQPVAAALAARGCPLLFLTGYEAPGGADATWGHVPVLRKPASPEQVHAAIQMLLRVATGSAG